MKQIKTPNRRAFTLTELLIVVIVIGVLSAVTLPKFNRVIENRKVTEAEEMMSAVRTEQERRCSLDQNYTMKFDNLSDVIASNNTKNYNYTLQNQGISAKSNSSDYTLKILSYQDGDFCCEGAGCDKLNKNYPKCGNMNPTVSACVGNDGGDVGPEPDPVEPAECTDGEVSGTQVCNTCGTQSTKKCVGGKWTNSLGTCSKTAEECAPKPECPAAKPADAVKNCDCGTVKASYYCDASTNYTWKLGEYPACAPKPADVTETCSDGKTTRKKPFTCVNGVWTPGNWDKECPEEEKHTCPEIPGDPRSLWSDHYNRCICPTAVVDSPGYSAFINGTCCNLSTPKTETKCWKPTKTCESSGKWTWQEDGNVTVTYTYTNSTTTPCNVGGKEVQCDAQTIAVAAAGYNGVDRYCVGRDRPWDTMYDHSCTKGEKPCIGAFGDINHGQGVVPSYNPYGGSGSLQYMKVSCKEEPCVEKESYTPTWTPGSGKPY